MLGCYAATFELLLSTCYEANSLVNLRRKAEKVRKSHDVRGHNSAKFDNLLHGIIAKPAWGLEGINLLYTSHQPTCLPTEPG